eukprot:4561887-Pleurochrysis_carterae.AAC.1
MRAGCDAATAQALRCAQRVRHGRVGAIAGAAILSLRGRRRCMVRRCSRGRHGGHEGHLPLQQLRKEVRGG